MERVKFFCTLSTAYQKGGIELDQNLLRINDPAAVLACIPAGYRKDVIPVNQIASVHHETNISGKRLFGGCILAMISFANLGDGLFPYAIFALIAILCMIDCCQQIVTVTLTSGERKYLHVSIFNKRKVKEMENLILATIAGRMNDTNVRIHTNRSIEATMQQTNQIVDAITRNNR